MVHKVNASSHCAIDGCDQLVQVREWCSKHYQQGKRRGVIPPAEWVGLSESERRDRKKAYKDNYRKKNREEILEKRRNYLADPEKAEITRLAIKKWKSSLNGRYYTLLTSSRNRGLVVELTREQWETIASRNCTFCGSEPFQRPSGTGIDRVDSSIGYTVENSMPCCYECNIMKGSTTLEEFIARIKMINNNYEPKGLASYLNP